MEHHYAGKGNNLVYMGIYYRTASVLSLCQVVYDIPEIRFMGGPARGGVAGVLHEVIQAILGGERLLLEFADKPLPRIH